MFRFGKGQLEILGQGACEVVAAQWNRTLPDNAFAVGDDKIAAVGPDVQGDDASLFAAAFAKLRVLAQEIEGHIIAQRQRRHLHDMDIDVDIFEVLQIAANHVALHGEQTDLRLHSEAVGHSAGADLLIIPDDLIEIEGDLLLGLEANDVGDFLFLNGRQLDEASQTALSGNADRHNIAAQVIARQEFVERFPGELIGVRVGLAEDFRMFHVIESGGDELSVNFLEADRLEAALAQVNAPNADRLNCHNVESPAAVERM